ncbi:leucine-rich repeat domain-containing protein [Eubacterium ramulus]
MRQMKKICCAMVAVVLAVSSATVPTGWMGICAFAETVDNVSRVSIDTTDIVLCGGLSDTYKDILTIPADVVTEAKIRVDNAENVSYEVTEGDNVTVEADGTVKVKYITRSWFGTLYVDGPTGPILEKPTRVEQIVKEGDAVVQVTADGMKKYVNVHVKYYEDIYADEKIQQYIDENISGKSLSDMELMKKITEYPASFDYGYEYSGYVPMIIYGRGDCWASTSAMLRMCELLGIEAWTRNGNKDVGAAGGHRNVMVNYNGHYYELDAGYDGEAPRYYSVNQRNSLFCYHYRRENECNVYQYDGNKDIDTLEIPASDGYRTVTEIADNFCVGSIKTCRKIYLPDTITRIGELAFAGFEQLTEINIPANIEEIGEGAFAADVNLKNFTCDASVKNYSTQDGILYNKDKTQIISVPGVSDTEIPSSVETISDGAFSYNTNLETVTIPATVKQINNHAFYNCSQLKTVYIEGEDIDFGADVFYGCNELVIRGITGSAVEKYAADNNIAFKDITSPSIPDGLADQAEDGNWYYYIDEKVATDVTTVAQNDFGWWYVKDGKVDFSYTGLAANECGWWRIVNGAVDFNCTSVVNSEYGWWYVRNGQIDFGYTGVAQNENGWWRIVNGAVDFSCNSVVNSEYGWWYIRNGQIDFTYTGVAQNENGWWRIVNGAVDFNCNSVVNSEYGWWYIRNGQIDFTYTGVAQNEYGWWRIENGALNFGFTGLAQNEYGWWYIKNGMLDFSYTGYVNWYGAAYRVQNGQVIF